jgi:hypothetical protein
MTGIRQESVGHNKDLKMALARNLSDNANNVLSLEFRLLIETDPDKRAQLQEMVG